MHLFPVCLSQTCLHTHKHAHTIVWQGEVGELASWQDRKHTCMCNIQYL